MAASAVQDLTAQTISAFTAKQDLSIVLFDAPWCVHSKVASPEYHTAASMAASESWTFGHVDCAAEHELCKELAIPIYPTLIVFHGQQRTVYNGERKAKNIFSFLRRHSHPDITLLSNVHDVADFNSKDRVTIVGYFDADDQISNTTFTKVARSLRGEHIFGSISDNTFGLAENLQKPGIILFKHFDEGKSHFADTFDEETIKDFINEAASPLISELGLDLRPDYAFAVDVPVAFIFVEGEQGREQLTKTLHPVAKEFEEQVGWVTGDPLEHAGVSSRVGLKPGSWPAFAIIDNKSDRRFVFHQRGWLSDLNEHSIRSFVQDFVHGKLQPEKLDAGLLSGQEAHVSSHDEL
ncbi:hypothetical protein TI39_contig4426g00001 [Zymoseptoria brevis]|uniref:Protein disulfide-isomerase n=1 Tax=Zymoseptoria brevis TaxID=1047168 RepID=A0A0F4G6W8_9PEZI|nr:hypothetical protein TI39_contig4426g00001 [Zymoseptoria brevis]